MYILFCLYIPKTPSKSSSLTQAFKCPSSKLYALLEFRQTPQSWGDTPWLWSTHCYSNFKTASAEALVIAAASIWVLCVVTSIVPILQAELDSQHPVKWCKCCQQRQVRQCGRILYIFYLSVYMYGLDWFCWLVSRVGDVRVFLVVPNVYYYVPYTKNAYDLEGHVHAALALFLAYANSE